MGMGMKSLKWEGIGTKNLFPHISSTGYLYWYLICGTGTGTWNRSTGTCILVLETWVLVLVLETQVLVLVLVLE